jgi:hypothetical protein
MILKLKYIIPVTILLVAGSCKKNLDINHDPDNPTSLPISKILPTVEKNLATALAMGPSTTDDYGNPSGGLSNQLETYVHRTTQRGTPPDQYTVTGTDFFMQSGWTDMYGLVLNNTERIIADGTAAGNMQYVGIAKIIKAYAFSQLVDVFGDVPFSEANKLKEQSIAPKFDDDAAIYPQLFSLLDEAIANLSATATNALKPGNDDVIYKGNIANWIKAANTIKLKLYTQERQVKNVTAEVNALITANNLIKQTSEGFMLPFGPSISPDDRNPGQREYFASQRTIDISPWFYETMKGINQFMPGTGNLNNPDPRIPYYFFNQIKSGQVAVNDANQTEYRDGSFVSIYFGTTGPDAGRSQQNTLTTLGIYPVGGRYDDGQGRGTGLNQNSSTGAAPYRFITYADRLYLEAELMRSGVATGDARAKLLAALNESFKLVDYVVNLAKGGQAPPALVGRTDVNTYIANVMAAYDADPSRQLQIIMTQKWISGFGNGVDAYTDYRRTRFPIIFDPNDPVMAPNHFVQPPINGDPVNPGAQKPVPVQTSLPYPLSIPWPTVELDVNGNAPAQKNPSTYKPFWLQ